MIAQDSIGAMNYLKQAIDHRIIKFSTRSELRLKSQTTCTTPNKRRLHQERIFLQKSTELSVTRIKSKLRLDISSED